MCLDWSECAEREKRLHRALPANGNTGWGKVGYSSLLCYPSLILCHFPYGQLSTCFCPALNKVSHT